MTLTVTSLPTCKRVLSQLPASALPLSLSLSLLRTQSHSLKFFITQEEPKKRLLAKINCPQHGMSFKANKKRKREREGERKNTGPPEHKYPRSLSLSVCPSLSLYNLLHPQVFTLYFPFRVYCELCMTIGFRIRRILSRTLQIGLSGNGCTRPHTSSSSSSLVPPSSILIRSLPPPDIVGFAFL